MEVRLQNMLENGIFHFETKFQNFSFKVYKLSEKRLPNKQLFSKMFLWVTSCHLNRGLLGGISYECLHNRQNTKRGSIRT